MRETSRGKWFLKVAGLLVVSTMLLAACGDSDDDSSSTTEAAAAGSDECEAEGTTTESSDSSVTVDLTEWDVIVDSELSAGNIAITANNRGSEAHELVIVEADDPSSFVMTDDNKVDESAFAEGAVIGEIEEFAAGGSCDGTFALDAGTYVFFCNITEEEPDGTLESHFEEGMFTVVTVS